jgi:hypothetical protein
MEISSYDAPIFGLIDAVSFGDRSAPSVPFRIDGSSVSLLNSNIEKIIPIDIRINTPIAHISINSVLMIQIL